MVHVVEQRNRGRYNAQQTLAELRLDAVKVRLQLAHFIREAVPGSRKVALSVLRGFQKILIAQRRLFRLRHLVKRLVHALFEGKGV